MLRVTSYVHQFLLNHLDKQAHVLDLTCGQGNDTYFCAQHFKSVISIDIQAEALQIAQAKCSSFTNIHFIHDDHRHIGKYLNQPLDAILFNSGYLPKSPSSIHTHFESSSTALLHAMQYLKTDAYVCLVLYRKHDHSHESDQLHDFLIQQAQLTLIERYSYPNDALSPLVLIFKKSNERP